MAEKGDRNPQEGDATLPAEALELFGLPLDEFTSARNELAGRLKKEGRTDDSEKVRALRKPNLAAWAVNQLARERSADVKKLLSVAQQISEAEDVEEVREAVGHRHEIASELVDAATEILESAGRAAGAGTMHQVTQTLLAAQSEPARERIGRGTLERPIESSGFDTGLGLSLDAGVVEDVSDKKEKEREEIRDDLARAREEADRLEREAERAQVAAERAHDAVAQANKKVARLEESLKELD